jgi:hypothetical protein
MRLKPCNIGSCWKGLRINFHGPIVFKIFLHFWVTFITFCNFLKILSVLKELMWMVFSLVFEIVALV